MTNATTFDLAALVAECEVKPASTATLQLNITNLLDHIGKAPNKNALQADLMRNLEQYAALTDADLEQVRAACEAIGVTATWWARDFKPAINRHKRSNETDSENDVPLSEIIRGKLLKLGYEFSFNVCTGETLVNGDPISDGVAATIRVQMRDEGVSSIKAVEDIYASDAHQNSYHPVVRYLEPLQWNGHDHIAALADHITDSHEPIQYKDGTQRTVMHSFLRRWLIGAVARAYRRGVQIPMLVLSGAQGKGKSYLAKWLCPLPEMFIESAIYPDNGDHMKYLASKWIWAVDELGATTRRADIEALKAFITKDVATFRAAYARYGSNLPALACFIGTVNDNGAGFLNDPTGNRRFAVVDLTHIDHKYSNAIEVNQIWAQALSLYRSGESWQFTPEETAAATTNAESHQSADPVTEIIARHFTIDPLQRDWQMTTDEIMDCLIQSHGFRQQKDRSFAMAIGVAMKKLSVQKIRPNRIYKFVGVAHVPNRDDSL